MPVTSAAGRTWGVRLRGDRCPRRQDEDLAARVVALVAEQTGYPPELLDLDLDLEADLGIDTVKQAELFAQVRETYGIERDDSLKLRDYPTLNHVIGFVRDRTPRPPTTPTVPSQTGDRGVRRGCRWRCPSRRVRIWRRGWWRWSPSRPATRPSCSTWTSTWRPTWASTRSSRPSCSPRSARPTGSNATTRSSCATTRRSTTSSASSATAPHSPARRRSVARDLASRRAAAPSSPTSRSTGRRRRVPAPRAGRRRAAAAGLVRADRRAAGGRLAGRRPARHRRGGRGVVGEARRSGRRGADASTWRPIPRRSPRSSTDWLAAGPIDGLYALAALDNERPIADLDIDQWHEGLRRRVKLLAAAARVLYERLDEAGSFLVARHPQRRRPRLRRSRRPQRHGRRRERLHQGAGPGAPRRHR